MTRPVHVLLVDDNPGDTDLTRDTLESGPLPMDIAAVIDGAQALAYMQRQPPYEAAKRPDLVLLDLNLPKVPGRDVLAAVKQDKLLCGIPVVVLSSSDAAQDVQASYALGANCYVTKPVGLQAFQSTVRSVANYWFAVARLP